MSEPMNLNVLGLSVQSLLTVLIVLMLLQCYGIIKCQEGVSASKQRFAGIRSEGYYGAGLSGANYNGGHLNFESNKGVGNVVGSGRQIDAMEGLASVTEPEGLSSVTEPEGYQYPEGLQLVE